MPAASFRASEISADAIPFSSTWSETATLLLLQLFKGKDVLSIIIPAASGCFLQEQRRGKKQYLFDGDHCFANDACACFQMSAHAHLGQQDISRSFMVFPRPLLKLKYFL